MKGTVKEKIFSRIISGGQTGVDRAALDAALELGLETGGWCPRGRRAENGRIPGRYPLTETGSWKYPVRTRKNVLEGDGTLILTRGEVKGGTALTVALAEALEKPCRVVDLHGGPPETAPLLEWGRKKGIRTLNVAGPRESEAPGIQEEARRFLRLLLAESKKTNRNEQGD